MKEEQRRENFHGADRPHVTSETGQNSDSDGIDLIELLLCLRAGIDTIMMLAGLSLSLALVFIMLTRNQVVETRTLELPGLPAWVWLACQNDMRCRTDMLSSWLVARAPAGVKISVTQPVITLTMHGSRATTSDRSAVINGYLSKLQQEWNVQNNIWQQAASNACSPVRKETELCAGVVLLLAQAKTGALMTVMPAEQHKRWPPGIVATLSVMAGLLVGAGVVLLKTAWQVELRRRGKNN